MKWLKLLTLFIFVISCSDYAQTKQVIMENNLKIKDRNSALSYYLKNKWIMKYDISDRNKLYTFNFSEEGWISDDELQYIIFFPEVKFLHLKGKKITDNVFYYIKDLNNLEAIFLNNTSVRGEGFKYLKNKTKLDYFVFRNSPISDNGIKNLSVIYYEEGIEHLDLNNTKITDEGMKYIAKMKFGKAYISLFKTKVTDEGIKYLAGFKELKEIDLRETKVTDKGGKWLQEQLPNTEIYWGKYIPDTPTGMDEEQ